MCLHPGVKKGRCLCPPFPGPLSCPVLLAPVLCFGTLCPPYWQLKNTCCERRTHMSHASRIAQDGPADAHSFPSKHRSTRFKLQVTHFEGKALWSLGWWYHHLWCRKWNTQFAPLCQTSNLFSPLKEFPRPWQVPVLIVIVLLNKINLWSLFLGKKKSFYFRP